MPTERTAAVILAAGLGTRMRSRSPKVMHPLAGRPMIQHLMATVNTLGVDQVCVVVAEGMEAVAEAVAPHPTVVQRQRLGTGHAVMAARSLLEGFTGDVLILYGDVPLVEAETLDRLRQVRRADVETAVVLLGFRPREPGSYGRLVMGDGGCVETIVEAADATLAESAITLCNAGPMAVDGSRLFSLLDHVGNDNATGEYYLTDLVAVARRQNLMCRVVEGQEAELIGINTRADLARAEALVQARLRARAMAEGVTLIDPDTVYLSHDTRFGEDVTVGPNVFFGPGVSVGAGAVIRSFCHFVGATIAAGAEVGPFARLRPGARIAEGAHVGNFVEIKNATVEAGAKVNHLSYIGDARVGAKANVGAGTITCNYDGFFKSFTDIGAGAFIGSNTSLVAPVTVGDGAIIGAGSVVTDNVAADALSLSRAPQVEKPNWARGFRQARKAEKEARAATTKGD